MTDLVHLTPLDPRYPSRLRGLENAPGSMTVKGGSTEAALAVAVVGSRRPIPEAHTYAGALGCALAKAGAVVVSGGALGVDGAAHRGALEAGGRTWAVAPTGHEVCFPPEHEELFAAIAKGPGAMLWPFPPRHAHSSAFLTRNRVLVTLSDAVVVVQAGPRSGALHAASWARKLNKPLWVVPVPPWIDKGFEGSCQLLEEGARVLTSTHLLLRSLELSGRGNRPPDAAQASGSEAGRPAEPSPPLSDREFKVLGAISTAPLHADAISASAGMSPQTTTAALLTLALENVVVEGPPGFFRRREAHNR